MQQLLSTLCQLLKAGRPILTEDDAASLEPGRELLLDHKILVRARTATHVTCDACHDDHVEEVTRVKGGTGGVTYHIPCPHAGWTVVVSERLQQWTIDIRRLVSLLGESVSQSRTPEEIVTETAWRLGTISIDSEHYGVVFVLDTISADPSVLELVAKKCPANQTAVIVGCGSPDGAGDFAGVLSLASAFKFTGDRFEFQSSQVRAAMPSGVVVRGNIFQRRGEFWEIAFQSQTIFLKDTVGLGYIARLLMDPHRSIAAVTLLAARTGIDPRVSSGSSGEMLDEQSRAEYAQRYQELRDDLDDANELNDHAKIGKLEGEMEQLANQLAAATGLGGRGRQTTDADRIRKSVSTAVARDIRRISKEHEALGRHLGTFISSGLIFRYAPEPPVDWVT